MSEPIASPVYTLGSWQGNVRDDWGVDWVVETEDGWSSSPPVRAVLEERQGADGGWNGPGLYSPRVVTLAGKALAPDRVTMLAAKDRIKAAVGPRAPVELVVDEAHMSRRAAVRLSDAVDLADWGARAFDWGLTLVAADPRRYAITAIGGSTALPDPGVGRAYPRTYDWSYGAVVGGSGSVIFTNAGDFDTCPATITITGPVTDPRVAHTQTSRVLAFSLTLGASEYLQIDLLAQTVLLAGTASRAGVVQPGSAWFMCVPGLNEIQFRGTPVAGATTPPVMTVTAASAWT